MPFEALVLAGGSWPDGAGMVGDNRGGYRSPAFQRPAARLMICGISCGDQSAVDEAFRAFDAVFSRQAPAGHFGGDATPSGVAFFLCEANQALLLLLQSRSAAASRARLDALVPGIRRAAAWLALPENRAALEAADARTPNRLLFDGLAFGLSGLLCGEKTWVALGREFVGAAIRLFRPEDGVFLEKGGHDSSYQATCAWLLQVWVLHFPEQALADAADRAVRWEAGRIKADGSVDVTGNTRTGLRQEVWQGRIKDVNYGEVLRCLLYYQARHNDNGFAAAQERLCAWMRRQQ